MRRRRRSEDTEPFGEEEEPPLLVDEAPVTAVPTDAARPPTSGPIELAFEPLRLTMALVNARLAYRLSVTNLSDAAIGPIHIACDIISAHASLGDKERLLFEGDMAEPRHQFASLPPGQSISLASELHLPIAAIPPIRSGDASLFVPLARFRIIVPDANRPPMIMTRIFLIGESPEQPGKRLKPIRIDLGARTFSRIGQREIA